MRQWCRSRSEQGRLTVQRAPRRCAPAAYAAQASLQDRLGGAVTVARVTESQSSGVPAL